MRLSESGSSVQLDEFESESNRSTDIDIDETISDKEEAQERRRKKHTDSCKYFIQTRTYVVWSNICI